LVENGCAASADLTSSTFLKGWYCSTVDDFLNGFGCGKSRSRSLVPFVTLAIETQVVATYYW
jgi:hypothetical protein